MSEESIARQISKYLCLKHPELNGLWRWDFGSGLYMAKGQAIRQKLLNPTRAWPDFQLCVATSWSATPFHSLFIELKKDGTRLKKRDGSWASDHIAEQAEQLSLLAEHGHVAQFAVGFDAMVELIESYLSPQDAELKEWAESF